MSWRPLRPAVERLIETGDGRVARIRPYLDVDEALAKIGAQK